MPTLDAEAVPAQVVVPARRTDEAPRRIRLQPSLVFSAVPDAVFRSQHPAASFAVEHGQVTHREPERAWRQAARPALIDQELVADLSFREWIDCHAQSIARGAGWNLEGGGEGCRIRLRLQGPQHASHHIPRLTSLR
jgi:hypothetical protein